MTTTVLKKQTTQLTPTSDRQPVKVYLACPANIDEVRIDFFKPARDQHNVTDYSMQLIKEIFLKNCISYAIVTSTVRTANSQVSIMYDSLKKGGISHYKKSGKELISIYQEMTGQGKSRDETIAAMQAHAEKVMAQGGAVSTHINPYNTLFYNVIDFDREALVKADTGKKLTAEEKLKLYNTCLDLHPQLMRVFDKEHGKDPALHLEIPQPIAYKDDEIAAMEKQKPFEQPELAKMDIERARGLPINTLKFAAYPYIFYKSTK